MAKSTKKLADSNPSPADAYATTMGNSPEVSPKTLVSENRVISSVTQAISVINTLEWDAQKLIKNAAKITSLKQGRRPYDIKKLEKQGKGYKTNLSSGSYSTTLRRVAPRLYMPLLNASTLTAAELPADTVNREQKQQHYREVMTNAIRSWPRWGTFVRLLIQEIVDYGFVFAAFTDPYEWQPHLVRMDRGFVPAGTEIMDLDVPFFAMKWDYQPSVLLEIVRAAEAAGVEGWNNENVAYCIQESKPATAPSKEPTGWRKWEELTREQVWNVGTAKNYRVVETVHLFALETTGKVSHYIVVKDAGENHQLLYEKEDIMPSMADTVIPITFNSTDGTIHGSWGAGHLLYDLGGLQEKIFCDMVDNLRNANKQRLQVKDPKDINDVKQVVNDVEVIVSGAEFANNLGGVQQNTAAYIQLKDILQQTMDSKVGAYVPPIPTQSSDIKAAQINAAMTQEKEVSDDAVEHCLSQVAYLIDAICRRLGNPESINVKAVEVMAELKKKLTDDEIAYLIKQPQTKSVTQFTPMAAQSRAQFAASYIGNALFKQVELAKIVAEGVPFGGTGLADTTVIQDGDQTETMAAQRQQILEMNAFMLEKDVPVLITDNHWVHMQTLKPDLIKGIQAKMIGPAKPALRHYIAHWTAGVSQKVLPDEAINAEKSFIADSEKAIAAIEQQQAQEQQMQQQMQAAAAQQGMPPGAVGEQGMPGQVGMPPPDGAGGAIPPEMGTMPPPVGGPSGMPPGM